MTTLRRNVILSSALSLSLSLGALAGCGAPMGEYQDQRGNSSSADAQACTKKATLQMDAAQDELESMPGDSVGLALLAAPDYTTVIKPQIMDMHCTAACHAPGKMQASVDLSTYVGLKNFYAASLADMQNGTMPIGGGAAVPAAKIALFQQWQAAGFPEKAADVPPPGTTPTPVPGTTGGTTTGSTTGSGTTASSNSTGSGSASKSAQCLQ